MIEDPIGAVVNPDNGVYEGRDCVILFVDAYTEAYGVVTEKAWKALEVDGYLREFVLYEEANLTARRTESSYKNHQAAVLLNSEGWTWNVRKRSWVKEDK